MSVLGRERVLAFAGRLGLTGDAAPSRPPREAGDEGTTHGISPNGVERTPRELGERDRERFGASGGEDGKPSGSPIKSGTVEYARRGRETGPRVKRGMVQGTGERFGSGKGG